MVKNSPANAGGAGDTGSIPRSGKYPAGGNDNPLQYSCLEKVQRQRSLAGSRPWRRKESDRTEGLSTSEVTGWCHRVRIIGPQAPVGLMVLKY